MLIMMVVPQLVSNITNAVSLLPDQIQDLVKKITELAKNNECYCIWYCAWYILGWSMWNYPQSRAKSTYRWWAFL